MDTRLYLDVARLSRETHWAHALAIGFVHYGADIVLGLLVLVAYLGAATGRTPGGARSVAAAIWAPVGAACAFAVAYWLQGLIGHRRPDTVHGAVVLVHGLRLDGLPSAASALAAAVAIGCFLVGARAAGAISVLVTLLVAFTRVYVGANFPLDVAAGILLGAVVALVGYLPVVAGLERLVTSPLGVVMAARPVRRRALGDGLPSPSAARSTTAGPAGSPPALAATGAVRVLEDRPLAPRSGPARPPLR